MKKAFLPFLIAPLLAIGLQEAKAQTPYKTAVGLNIDLGDGYWNSGATLVGPQIKHNFQGPHAGNAQLLFGDNIIALGVDYTYNKPIKEVAGLSWYAGIGPQLSFVDYDVNIEGVDDKETYFAIRPAAGAEYKIKPIPLVVHFEWKPWWNLSHDSDFEPARFTIGAKYTLKL